jgi:hypothetical protein
MAVLDFCDPALLICGRYMSMPLDYKRLKASTSDSSCHCTYPTSPLPCFTSAATAYGPLVPSASSLVQPKPYVIQVAHTRSPVICPLRNACLKRPHYKGLVSLSFPSRSSPPLLDCRVHTNNVRDCSKSQFCHNIISKAANSNDLDLQDISAFGPSTLALHCSLRAPDDLICWL